MKFVAMVTRTLRPGKTYDDYRKAWFHSNGFGVQTTMYTVVSAFNPRDIISIGILDADEMGLFQALQIDVKDRLANPLDDIVESTIVRNFGIVTAIDDFSAAGALQYVEAQVDGKPTDYTELADVLEAIAVEIRKASAERDRIKLKLALK